MQLLSRPAALLLLLLLFPSGTTSSSDEATLSPYTSLGLLVDAGSGGSRLHIYRWAPRIFDRVPPPISHPTPDEKYTGRMNIGISSIALLPKAARGAAVAAHLAPLIDFAKQQVGTEETSFGGFPFYFKGTGGLRELSLDDREDIMNWVRIHLSDRSFNPFYFTPEMARVISGEEEAIFSWVAMNFLLGNLLTDSEGVGEAFTNTSIGTLDLGGSSTQIAFFVPSQDISEGLYKLQIGGNKHWNVYTKSFLQFGINSARQRHMRLLVDSSTSKKVEASCFHSGYKEAVQQSIPGGKIVDVCGPSSPQRDQYRRCYDSLFPLMEKDANSYCNIVYHGECSIGGAYQPSLPTGPNGNFFGTSSYKFAWKILMLPPTASLELWETRASDICSMNFGEVASYAVANNITLGDAKLSEMLPYFCFLAVYPLVLVREGYGFSPQARLTVVDDVNGNKAGWALGAIMHEINSLPWELRRPDEKQPWGWYFLSAAVGMGIGAAMAFSVSRELFVGDYYSLSRPTSRNTFGMYRFETTPPNSGYFRGSGSGSGSGSGREADTPPRWYNQVAFSGSEATLDGECKLTFPPHYQMGDGENNADRVAASNFQPFAL